MASLPQIDSLRFASPTSPQKRSAQKRRRVNVPFVAVVVALVAYGLLIVYSAVSVDPDYSFKRQLMGVGAGAVIMALVWSFDYRHLAGFTNLFLVINVVLILSPHIPGIGTDAGMGAKSWINIGMQIQPGEFAKVTVILLDAAVVARYGGRLDDLREYLKALAYILIPFLCIMTQPDLGTGLVYLFIGAVALVVGGSRTKYLLVTLVVGIICIICVFIVDETIKSQIGEYKLLKQYQRNRLFVFLNQDSADLTSEGYNLRQAQIAIGSGGVFGKGLFKGTQHSLGLLPEAPTDFIFCVLAEELGFVGVVALLGLYGALILISFRIAASSSDLFGMVIVMCVIGMWLFQILENIGMDCGLMPITGIPLPFVSYGSSFMVVNFALLGLIGSVWSHNALAGR